MVPAPEFQHSLLRDWGSATSPVASLEFLRLHPALLLCQIVFLGSGSRGANKVPALPLSTHRCLEWADSQSFHKGGVLSCRSRQPTQPLAECIKERTRNGRTCQNPPPKSSGQGQGCTLLLCEWRGNRWWGDNQPCKVLVVSWNIRDEVQRCNTAT